ncbi:MAG: HAD family hydrolase [Treponema sp.]|nr:HAD family hydrolase [Treponema sp.]
MGSIKFRGVIFDCDGTLIDTLGDLASAMNKILEKRGFPLFAEESYRDKVGWGLKKLALLSIPPEKQDDDMAEEIAAELYKNYSENPLGFTKPYPGIPELVAELKRRKIKLAVLTNKSDPAAQIVIGSLFPQGSFDIVQGQINGKPCKPDPAAAWEIITSLNLTPRETIFAGDSEIDIHTALDSGCHAVGVSWGYRSREDIIEAGAERIIDRPEELLALF